MSYENPINGVYRLPAAAIAGGGDLATIRGPKGKKGRFVGVAHEVTTDVTGSDETINIGDGSDVDAYGTGTVPVAAAGNGGNEATPVKGHEIPANGKVVVGAAGDATAGAADLMVYIDWY